MEQGMESPIKIIRNRIGISQGILAISSNIPQSRISAYECGYSKLSELEAQKIAKSMGIDANVLKLENEKFIEFKRNEINIRIKAVNDLTKLS